MSLTSSDKPGRPEYGFGNPHEVELKYLTSSLTITDAITKHANTSYIYTADASHFDFSLWFEITTSNEYYARPLLIWNLTSIQSGTLISTSVGSEINGNGSPNIYSKYYKEKYLTPSTTSLKFEWGFTGIEGETMTVDFRGIIRLYKLQ